MGLFEFFRRENRAEEKPAALAPEGKGAELLEAALGRRGNMTAAMAMQIPAVARCVHMVAQAAASLPVKLYRKSGKGVEEVSGDRRTDMLCGDTGDTLPGAYMRYLWVRDLLLTGTAYGFIERDSGVPARIFYVSPEDVGVLISSDDGIHKNYRFSVRGNTYYPFQLLKIFRCPDGFGGGRGIISENSLVLDTAYNLFEFQRNQMKKGGAKKGFLKTSTHVSDQVIEEIREKWRRLYSNRDSETVMFLNDGIDFREISNTSMEMQLNQNMKTISSEIMRIFGSEDGMLTADTVKNAVMPVLDMMETAFDSDLLLESEKGNVYFAFDTKELTRGDISTRFGAYAVALDKGFMQIDEVRELEDLSPLGIDFIKLNLADSFYDPKTRRIYTPNTNQWTEFGVGGTEANAAVPDSVSEGEIEERFNPNHDPETGRFASGDGGNISAKELSSQNFSDNVLTNEEKKAILREKIEKGELPLKVRSQKQNTHIKGTQQYKEGNSYLSVDLKEIQQIVDDKHLTGTVYKIRNSDQFREKVKCDKVIGVNVDKEKGIEEETSNATIHYSKKGTHIVPTHGKEKKHD